jgi:hypothetical protein
VLFKPPLRQAAETLPASQKNDHEKPINRKLNNYEYEI